MWRADDAHGRATVPGSRQDDHAQTLASLRARSIFARFEGWYVVCLGRAMKSSKLLQVVVVLGAGMTGGLQATACGGSTVDSGAAADAAADSASSGYGRISIDAAYGKISVDAAYGRIMPIPLDASDDDAADAEPSDANEAG
jgi:hypothetical protein